MKHFLTAKIKHGDNTYEIKSPYIIGRQSGPPSLLGNKQVSKTHAVILFDEESRKWVLGDLRSTNGTYLNGKPVSKDQDLQYGDIIQIGGEKILFAGDPPMDQSSVMDHQATQVIFREVDCWFFLMDIKNSTRLTSELSANQRNELLFILIQEFLSIFDEFGVSINEKTGDGFIAFVESEKTSPKSIISLIKEIQKFESATKLEYRILIHKASVSQGKALSEGLCKFSGNEFNFIFKAEKQLDKDGTLFITDEAIKARLSSVRDNILSSFSTSFQDQDRKIHRIL